MWQSFFDSHWFNLIFAVCLAFSIAAGILYARWYKKQHTWESTGMEAAVTSIFGLIISFTFLQSGNAHRERHA